ncbi:MAG TPA: LacI family DNA-binding transcriptional regulator [Clostridia bacterium]|nr:LacI family DNA-binding transcriptional regulator [Clostridia bacterium]
MKPMRLEDVATLAGVSTITVSRVINSPELVKPATREKVERALAELNYVQNPVARALASNKIGIVAVYIPATIDLTNPFVMHFVAGISEVLSKHVYSFLIRRELDSEHLCDGYIATGLLKDEVSRIYHYTHERKRPLVLFGHNDNPDIDCIDVDNVAGAQKVTEVLLANGHRNIALINVNEDKDYTVDRALGFARALQMAGIDPASCPQLTAPNNVDGGYAAMKSILAEHPECTGVFCATDTLAIGAANAIVKAGKKIPQDLSLVGFDGLGHDLLVRPNVTTVHQPVYEIGMRLAEALIARLNGSKKRVKQLVEPEIILRDSVSSAHS